MIKNYQKFANHINKKDWWRTAINKKAIKERGLFLASSYIEAEFYGRPIDTPFRVKIKNPLIGSEKIILKRLNLKAINENSSLAKTFAFDKKIAIVAIKRGYDCIAYISPNEYKTFTSLGRLPRRIELQCFSNAIKHIAV